MKEPGAAFASFNALALGVTLEEVVSRPDAATRAVEVRGHIDTGNADRLQDALLDFISDEPDVERLCLDVSRVTLVSSRGIGALAAVRRRMAERKGTLVLHRANPRLKELFIQLGFSEIFTLSDEPCGAPPRRDRAAFPLTLHCPRCRTALRVSKPGRFRCKSCGSTFTVEPAGKTNPLS